MRVLRKKDVAAKVGLSAVHVMRLAKAGRFPEPFPLGPSSIGWLESEVNDWIEDRARRRKPSQDDPVDRDGD